MVCFTYCLWMLFLHLALMIKTDSTIFIVCFQNYTLISVMLCFWFIEDNIHQFYNYQPIIRAFLLFLFSISPVALDGKTFYMQPEAFT